jgi:hypothetical protein
MLRKKETVLVTSALFLVFLLLQGEHGVAEAQQDKGSHLQSLSG